MTSKLTRERLQEIAEDGFLKHGESKELARMALAAMDSSESVELPLDYLQGHKDGLEWAAQLAEANHPETGGWLYDDPIELSKAIRKGPDMPPVQPVADSEPVAWTWHYREQWHVTNDERRAEFVAKDGDVAVLPLYRHAQSAQISEPVLPLQDKDLQGVIDALEHPAGINAAGKQVVRHALVEIQERRKADREPVAEVVSIYGDPEAFGEREIRPLVGIQQMPYGTKLYRHAQPAPERDQVRIAHAEWSQATFGNVGPVGPLKHLSKEALEAAEQPFDLSEWADMQFLLWDAQRRAGITDDQITQAMIDKLAVNKQREWPEPKDGEPRLHIIEQPAPVVPDDVLDALQKVARIRLGLNDFDGDRRGIADCLCDAEEALIEVVNRRAAMLAAVPQEVTNGK